MTYMRGMDNEMHRVPERDLNPPDDKPEFTPDQLQVARDEMIEIILSFGQWPQPLRSRKYVSAIPKEFDLYEFLFERTWQCMSLEDQKKAVGKDTALELYELLEFLILALSDHGTCGAFSDSRDKWEKRVTKWLISYFTDTDRGRAMVEERCEEIERADREDH